MTGFFDNRQEIAGELVRSMTICIQGLAIVASEAKRSIQCPLPFGIFGWPRSGFVDHAAWPVNYRKNGTS